MKYELRAPLESNSPANGDDVWFAKTALRDAGYYEEPKHGITPYPDARLFEAIKEFQKENDLEVDGHMRPGGETEIALTELPEAKSFLFSCSYCPALHGGVFSPQGMLQLLG